MKYRIYQRIRIAGAITVLVLPLIAVAAARIGASASSTDYSIIGDEITQDDTSATISIVSSKTDTYLGMTLAFPTSEDGESDYFTLDSFAPAEGIVPSTADVENGTVYWADLSLTGQSVEAGTPIISATFSVDSEIATGIYSFPVYVSAINATNDDEDFTLTATVVVNKGIPDYRLDIVGIGEQEVVYTGSPVELQGDLTVVENEFGITAEDLTTIWYASDGTTVITRPTNAGSYYVAYTYLDDDCWGELKVQFSIAKAISKSPEEATAKYSVEYGTKLSEMPGEHTLGFVWENPNDVVTKGKGSYHAFYTQNNDPDNYLTVPFDVSVYGLSRININVTVKEGNGSYTVAGDLENVLEDSEIKITLTPAAGYYPSKVLLYGSNVVNRLVDNVLTFTAGIDDMEIEIYYTNVKFSFSIDGKNVQTDPTGVFEVTYGANQTVIIEVNHGYRLTMVNVNGVEKKDEVMEGKLIVPNITHDTEVYIEAEKIVYEITEGDKQTITPDNSGSIFFVVDVDSKLYGKDSGVFIDGELVDSRAYRINGTDSLIVRFNEDFIDSIEDGNHSITIMLSDGGTANGTFTVEGIKVPNTGGMVTSEANIISKIIILPVIAFVVITFVYLSKKHRPAKVKFNGE